MCFYSVFHGPDEKFENFSRFEIRSVVDLWKLSGPFVQVLWNIEKGCWISFKVYFFMCNVEIICYNILSRLWKFKKFSVCLFMLDGSIWICHQLCVSLWHFLSMILFFLCRHFWVWFCCIFVLKFRRICYQLCLYLCVTFSEYSFVFCVICTFFCV